MMHSSTRLSRRRFLQSLATAGAFASLAKLNAQGNPRRIDVHHHFQAPGGANTGLQWWTPGHSLELMDKYGISLAMISNPGVSTAAYDGTMRGNDAARRSNEYGAKLV